MRWIQITTLGMVLLMGLPVEGHAAEGEAESRWEFTLKGGVGLETNSQSLALAHALQPRVRFEWLTALSRETRLGVELSGVLSDEVGYQLFGGWLVGRAALSRGEVFSAWLGVGVGLGTDAAILHPDLISEGDLALWHQMGVLLRWELGAGVSLGIDVLNENLSAVSLAGTVGYGF